MKGLENRLKNCKTQKPTIIKNNDYVLVGSIDHGQEIPQEGIIDLISSLDKVVALKMESGGYNDEITNIFHPMSTEILAKASVGSAPISYFHESNEHDIGYYLLKSGVPGKLAEVYVPCMIMLQCNDVPAYLFDNRIILALNLYKQERFSFLNPKRAAINFWKVANYWKENQLDAIDLNHFAYDFEKFMGDVREFEFWKSDLLEFRKQYQGKIAVCCGVYHLPFIKSVLDEEEIKKPNWESHIGNRREDKHLPQYADKLKEIYNHIDKAINS